MSNGKTKADLQIELDEANDRIEELEAKLEEIINIADSDEEDDDDDFQDENSDELD